jgi:hypothetical protein
MSGARLGARPASRDVLCERSLWIVIMAHSAGHILLIVGLYFS